MVVVIYSAGPFLEQTMERCGHTTIAINAALARVPWSVDWYCAGDEHAYDEAFTKGRRPLRGWLAQTPTIVKKVQARPGWGDLAALSWPLLPYYPDIERMSFSITAAYLLAASLGATKIITYGNDRCDTGEMVTSRSGQVVRRYSSGRAQAEERERQLVIQMTGILIEDRLAPKAVAAC